MEESEIRLCILETPDVEKYERMLADAQAREEELRIKAQEYRDEPGAVDDNPGVQSAMEAAGEDSCWEEG